MRDDHELLNDLRLLLERAESVSPVQAVEAVAEELAAAVGAREVSFLITDFTGRAVFRMGRPVPGSGATRFAGKEQILLSGSVHERVLQTQRLDVRSTDRGTHLVVPVTARGNAIGLIELLLPYLPDERTVSAIAATGHALAHIVVANRRHTDLFEWGQRSTPFTLAAEIQRRGQRVERNSTSSWVGELVFDRETYRDRDPGAGRLRSVRERPAPATACPAFQRSSSAKSGRVTRLDDAAPTRTCAGWVSSGPMGDRGAQLAEPSLSGSCTRRRQLRATFGQERPAS